MATKPDLRPIEMNRPVRRAPLSLKMRVFIGVWVLAAAAAVYLKFHAAPLAGVEGRVEVKVYNVAAVETGRVLEVPVEVGQRVSRGDVLVRLDTSRIDHEIELAEAELQQELAKLKVDRVTDERPFADAVERYRTELERQRTEAERDRADLEAVRARIRWWQGAVDSKVASTESLEELKAEAAALSRRVAAHPAAIAALEQGLARAIERLEAYRTASAGADEDDAEESGVALLRAKVATLRARRDLLTLRAPADALVHRVLKHEGDVARPGDPMVVLRSARSDRVQAYVTDAMASVLMLGDRAQVMPRDGSMQVVQGRVLAIGSVLPVPDQLMQDVRVQPWGVEILIGLEGEHNLLPGQAVDVQFERDRSAEPVRLPVPPAPPPAPQPSPEILPATVPHSLAASTVVEPSGLVWLPELDRFLVVSDDTGEPGSDTHPPWVLLMDAPGTFEARPMVVEGVPALNDVESVARTSDGTVWLLSSQSVSRRGKRPDSRTWLVRVRVDGGRLVATGRASLAGALAAIDAAGLDALGLGEIDPAYDRQRGGFDRVLDIEGMTADGQDLLIGPRRPIDRDGRALLWRLSDPARFVETGSLEPGMLAVVARLDMGHAGVADLALLPDGRLAVLAVGLRPGDGRPGPDSALWVFDPPLTGQPAGTRVKEFVSLHAEGVAFNSDPGSVIVIFDRNREVPLWTRVGVP